MKKEVRGKRMLQNISLFLGSMVVFMLLSEMVLTFLGYGDLILYEPDHKLFWKPKPNQNCFTKFEHKPVHINSHGSRGKEFQINKPNNVYRIITVGDSKTFGWGLTESETYSGLLESYLQAQFKDSLKVEVINAGVNAWSYSQIYVYLRDIAVNYSPDMVIIGDANMWTQFTENSSSEFIDDMMKKVWIKNFLRRSAIYHFVIEVKLKRYYYKYRRKFIPIKPENDTLFQDEKKESPYTFFEKEIVATCKLLKDHNIGTMMVYIPHEKEVMSNETPKILAIKQKVCSIFGIPLIDFSEIFTTSKKLYLAGDPVHPNVEGNRIIAGELYEYYKN